MSRADELAARIEKTVGEWLAEHGGGMPTGFVAAVTFLDEDGDPGWCSTVMPGQSGVLTMGILRWVSIDFESATAEVLRNLGPYVDDDE